MMKLHSCLFVALLLFGAASSVPSADLYWDINSTTIGSSDSGDASATWNSTNTFWSPNTSLSGTDPTQAWVADSVAIFSSGGSSSYTVTVADAESASGLTFSDQLVTLTGSGPLTLSGATPAINVTSGIFEERINVPLAGPAVTSLNLTGVSGAALFLGGANTYTGTTSVGAGLKLKLGASGVIPDTSPVMFTLGDAATELNLNGFNETVKSIGTTGTGGVPTLILGTNTLTLSDPAGESYAGLYTSTGTMTGGNTDFTQPHGTIVKNGTGTLILNNFPTAFNSGEFILNAGTVDVRQNNVFGAATANSKLTINGGKISTNNATRSTGTRNFDISDDVEFDMQTTGIFQVIGKGNTSAHPNDAFNAIVTLKGDHDPIITVSGAGSVQVLGRIVDETGNPRGFVKAGSGALVMQNNANTYHGDTTLEAGILRVLHQTRGGAGTTNANVLDDDLVGETKLGNQDTNNGPVGRLILKGGILEMSGAIASGSSPPNGTFPGVPSFTETANIDNARTETFANPLRIEGAVMLRYSAALADMAGITNVDMIFNTSDIVTTGGSAGDVSMVHNNTAACTPNCTFRPIFTGSGFDFTRNIVLTSGAGTTKVTELNSTNTSGTQTFSGSISGTGAFRRNGVGGTTVLSGANTFTGGTTVEAGTLTSSGASATLGGGDVAVNGGNASISAGVVNAILDTAKLTLLGGGTTSVADVGFIALAAGINERVGTLVLGSTTYTTGTFGSLASSATFKDNEYFSGTGIISVGPAGIPGDFNSDGKVDAGDYATWRKNDGTSNALANDNGLGTPVGAAHYSLWRANFGNPPGAGAGGGGLDAGAVPEPGSMSLVIFAIGSALVATSSVFRRRR